MVLNIYQHIADQLLAQNSWLQSIDASAIKLKDGRVVNFIGNEKSDFGFKDTQGIGGYIRIDPSISYSDIKKTQSCKTEASASQNAKLVIYAVDQLKPLHPFKVENKITFEINTLNLSGYLGVEQKIKSFVKSTNMSFSENFLSETGKEYQLGANIQIIIFNFVTTWISAKDNCEDCDVYEENKCDG